MLSLSLFTNTHAYRHIHNHEWFITVLYVIFLLILKKVIFPFFHILVQQYHYTICWLLWQLYDWGKSRSWRCEITAKWFNSWSVLSHGTQRSFGGFWSAWDVFGVLVARPSALHALHLLLDHWTHCQEKGPVCAQPLWSSIYWSVHAPEHQVWDSASAKTKQVIKFVCLQKDIVYRLYIVIWNKHLFIHFYQ